MRKHVIALLRDPRFSPHSEANDRAILLRTLEELSRREKALTWQVYDERDWTSLHGAMLADDAPREAEPAFYDEADLYVSMARNEDTLGLLHRLELRGKAVVNPTWGVEQCHRSVLDHLLRANRIPVPPLRGEDGYWLKRGDGAAQTREDVVYCSDRKALNEALEAFRRRGVTDPVVSAHVKGDVVKFYGVGTRFFRYYYPTDDGISKFGDEKINGAAHHYPFRTERLMARAQQIAALTGVHVYGGDAIVRPSGRFVVIDFNDWPSFARCRSEAAAAIAEEVMEQGLRNDVVRGCVI